MGDFTKDELLFLYSSIYERPNRVTNEMEMMKEKIQSMIDNYCEHKNSGQDYSCNRCWDCHASW